jgi:nicotinamidase-related amidase
VAPVLLIIDAQEEYFPAYGRWPLVGGEEAAANIRRILSAFRAARLPRIHIRHEALDPDSPVFRSGTPGVDWHPPLVPEPSEPVITKHVPGAFTDTPLAARLAEAGADTVVVTGFQTHHCCDTTTRQARERGFDVIFVADATATRNLTGPRGTVPAAVIQEATLAVVAGFGAQVVDTDALLARLPSV